MTTNTAVAFLFCLALTGGCAAIHLRARRFVALQRIVIWSALVFTAFGFWQTTLQPEFAADEMGQSLVAAGFFWLGVVLVGRELVLIGARFRARRTVPDLPRP